MSSDRGALDRLKIDRTQPAPASRSGWLLALAILVAIGGVAWWWMHRAPAIEVATATVREQAAGGGDSAGATLLNASGYVTARRAATVSAKVTGKVTEVLVEEGMSVNAGAVLARLDDANVQAGLHLAEARVVSTRRIMEETEPTLAFARLELERFTKLKSSNVSSQQELAKAESEVRMLEARMARQAAEVVEAERQVDEWKQQVADTTVRAPFSGVITTKDAQPGEMISPMSSGGFTRTGICTVVDMSSLEIEVDVNESYINRVRPGLPAVATLDAYPDWRISCKVIAIIPTADRQKATVKVRIGFDQPDPRVLPEMGVKVAFQSAVPAATASSAASRKLVVPEAAVRQADGRSIVWVVKEGRVERRAVSVSHTAGGEAALSAGLNLGETVVLDPPAILTDSARVTVRRGGFGQ
jgi:RND family efflux transporter MFP subunit